MKSLAIIYSAKSKPLKLDEIEINDPGPEQVLVKLYASGICHSQLINLNRDPLRPELLGHEGSGKVLKKGSSVKHLKEGDDILISWMPHKSGPNTKYLEWSSIRYKGKKITTLIFTWSKYSLMHHQFITKLPKKVDKYSCSILGCAGIAGQSQGKQSCTRERACAHSSQRGSGAARFTKSPFRRRFYSQPREHPRASGRLCGNNEEPRRAF